MYIGSRVQYDSPESATSLKGQHNGARTMKTIKQAAANLEAAIEIIAWQEERITKLEQTIAALATASQQAASPSQSAAKGMKERDYGPASQRKMTTLMALRILVGPYSRKSVRWIADYCGLSRGQVYSLKGGYTMKTAWKAAEKIKARRLERATAAVQQG